MPTTMTPGAFAWLTRSTPVQRRALGAACLGWMLDSFDVNLYALVLASVMADLGHRQADGRPHRLVHARGVRRPAASCSAWWPTDGAARAP